MVKQWVGALLAAFGVLIGCTSGAEQDLSSKEDDMDVVDNSMGAENTGVAEDELNSFGICRIKKIMGVIVKPSGRPAVYVKKGVAFYHTSDPTQVYDYMECGLFTGTSKCCTKNRRYNLSYDECKRLRHEPDC